MAFFTDAYIFSWFWDNTYALLFIILLMHVCNLFFIYKICEKVDIKLNAFCLSIFALSPMLIEGLYWISASSRIVVSLFFCLASIYLLLQSFDEERKIKKLIMFYSAIFLNLICVGYYEQTIALNLFLFTFVLICLKKYKYIGIPVISTTWIGAWYMYFMSKGQMQARGTLNLIEIFRTTLNCIKMVHNNLVGQYEHLIYSIGRGTTFVLNSFVSLILLGIIAYFIYYIYKNDCNKDENKHVYKKIILGVIILIVPFLPFIVLETQYIAIRNMYFSALGISILFEVIIDLILKFISSYKIKNILKTVICGFLMIIFIIANIDGVNNYKKVYEIDNKVAKQIVDALDDDIFEKKETLSINYNQLKLDKYKNISSYVISAAECDWGLMGKIQLQREDTSIGTVYINSKQDEADYALFFDDEMNLINVKENIREY